MFIHLTIEDTNCQSACKFFYQSCLIQDFSCSSVCRHYCLILLFMMGHTFSIGDRSAGWSVTSVCLWNHSVVAHAKWDLALFWSNIHGFPMKHVILMAVYVSVQSQYMPPCQWYLRKYAMSRFLLHLSLVKVCMVPLVSRTENLMSVFPKNKLKHGLIWPQHTFPLSFWLSEISSGPENQTASLHKTDVQSNQKLFRHQI